ncbi:MAG: mycothiol transferase [Gemmatimonadota bacterium]
MTSTDLLTDAFGRIRETVHQAVDGLRRDQLAFRVDDDTNSIAWLVWHLTRIQDDHVADVAEVEQVWTAGGWVDRFGLPLDRLDHGYGHSSKQVAAVQADAELLTAYHDAVYEQTLRFLEGISDTDLPRIVDTRWDPPVTLAVRLVSVISDDLQHAGQAAFLRGIVGRR